jgi:competence CoiA-like predicted nuclease
MQWALPNPQTENRVAASPQDRAFCPCCHDVVIAKCGTLVTWHWAHKAFDCDPWYEPESQWHLDWKSKFPAHFQEVVVGCHRADIKTSRLVVELQASCISPEEIYEREHFYSAMLWLLKGEDFAKNMSLRPKERYTTFRWKWPRRSWWNASKPIIVDFLPRGLFWLRKVYPNVPCGGWGTWLTEQAFFNWCGCP